MSFWNLPSHPNDFFSRTRNPDSFFPPGFNWATPNFPNFPTNDTGRDKTPTHVTATGGRFPAPPEPFGLTNFDSFFGRNDFDWSWPKHQWSMDTPHTFWSSGTLGYKIHHNIDGHFRVDFTLPENTKSSEIDLAVTSRNIEVKVEKKHEDRRDENGSHFFSSSSGVYKCQVSIPSNAKFRATHSSLSGNILKVFVPY
ncbi:hypothetical protein H4219_001138 [Mycoemilia scoparia]|uniref:SHSP domain-containing protein n=1 Tax=Mycoemilia scoparia TaxID=417184 RepID=A0A9W8DVT2_9FUNG|nr:hypothetical protein H4219_001138 [Mycoemilia scoparia]